MRVVRLSWVAGVLAGLVFGGQAEMWAGLSVALALAWAASAVTVAALGIYGAVSRARVPSVPVRAEVYS